MPVWTMAMPYSRAAWVTSSSRAEPPGWATNATPWRAAVQTAFSSGRPWLVEALIDQDVNAWTYPLFRRYEIGD